MQVSLSSSRRRQLRSITAVALLAAASSLAALAQSTQHYTVTDLTSNLSSLAPTRDANLVNPWGLSRSSKGPWWISDNGTGLSTLYDGTGKIQPLVVTIPSGGNSSPTGTPTGTVFNGDPTAFEVAPGKAADFLFVTEDGTISGWNPVVNLGSAVIVVNNKNAVYKGATIATAQTFSGPASFLYVANFRSGEVEVYDSKFKRVSFPEKAFRDDVRANYGPFNVQNIGGNLYVAYARQGSGGHDEVDGPDLGFVNVYAPTGQLLLRLQRGKFFNAPWGMALASGDFGAFTHCVLVGQFGSGEILAFDTLTGAYKGTLTGSDHKPVQIGGLWALSYGNDQAAGPATSLYFTAGPNAESNGLFGTVTAVENPGGNDQ